MKPGKNDTYHLPDEELKEEVKNIIICDTQTISGQIYVWNKNTNEFITQGKDMNDIVEFFKNKHPNTKVILTERANEETRVQTNG
jgi:fatty acid-binding protein DegV